MDLDKTQVTAPQATTLAIDPGIHNCGMCEMDSYHNVLFWDCVDLVAKKRPTIETLVQGTAQFFQDYFRTNGHRIALVRIEQQPNQNQKMKVLAHVIQGIAIVSGLDVVIVSPKKYKEAGGTYAFRKKHAVTTCQDLVRDSAYEQMFCQSKKKDDLADAYLLARWTG